MTKANHRTKFIIKFLPLFVVAFILFFCQRQGLSIEKQDSKELQNNFQTILQTDINRPLSQEAKKILEQNGTEPPFSSPLLYEKRKGTYHCAKCGNLLFTSEMKYESGTGWPSFYDHVTGSLEKKLDFSLIIPRTEYHCSRCGGHQGHVFKDGPAPTFLRWCNNGLALNFRPRK
ncbi:MAG: peptide-methionine (R)-S-oxide reductase MsrB [Pseudomonadota bacterium]|nr:peptide-methionine (R)-S-oxide reductase MsrB [Pseudomonadota bacterium]